MFCVVGCYIPVGSLSGSTIALLIQSFNRSLSVRLRGSLSRLRYPLARSALQCKGRRGSGVIV